MQPLEAALLRALRYSLVVCWMILAGGFFGSHSRLEAQGCCTPSNSLSGLSNSAVEAGSLQTLINYEFENFSNVYEGSMRIDPDPLNRRRTLHSVGIQVEYGIASRMSVVVQSLFTVRKNQIQVTDPFTSATTPFVQDASGLGDLNVLLKYNVVPYRVEEGREFSLGLGGTIPTGSIRDKSNGTLLPFNIQSGTGAWSLLLWLYASQAFVWSGSPLQTYMTASYRVNGSNVDSYRISNILNAAVGSTYQLWDWLSPAFEVRLVNEGPDIYRGQEQQNTGLTSIEAMAGMNFIITDGTTVMPYTRIPVYTSVIGNQLRPAYYLGLSAAYTFSRN